MPKSGRPRVRQKGKKITSRAFLTKAILAIRDKIRKVEMFPNLPVKDSKTLERTEVKEI